jgi:hypothetical protein
MKKLKEVRLGDQILLIDDEMINKENNKAEVQCADNMHAFFNYKKNDLFGGSKYRPKHEVELKYQKQMIKAYKLMSKSIKP